MNKLFHFIKTRFLTRQFLTFGFIGVINTMIHMIVYWLLYNKIVAGPFLSNTAAFISASTFSYFANALFTFKPDKRSTSQFTIVMAVFLVRLLISNGLTVMFDHIVQNWLMIDYSAGKLYSLIAPFIASALLIPVAFIALKYVFAKTGKTNEK
jgi:putative flippase GtrA